MTQAHVTEISVTEPHLALAETAHSGVSSRFRRTTGKRLDPESPLPGIYPDTPTFTGNVMG